MVEWVGWLREPTRFEGETMNAKLKWQPFAVGALLACCLAGIPLSVHAVGKDDPKPVRGDPNDPTFRLSQAIDTLKGGKLTDFYVLADVYKDPAQPNEESQHILKVEYDKAKMFGKLQIVVRSVGKIHPDQMKAYTTKDFFEFGLSDQSKFIKTEAGPFGKPGDMYLRSTPDRPLSSAPVTDDVRKDYEAFVTEYVLPAVEKK